MRKMTVLTIAIVMILGLSSNSIYAEKSEMRSKELLEFPIKDSGWGLYQVMGAYFDTRKGIHFGEDWNKIGGDDQGTAVYPVMSGEVIDFGHVNSTDGDYIIVYHKGTYTIPMSKGPHLRVSSNKSYKTGSSAKSLYTFPELYGDFKYSDLSDNIFVNEKATYLQQETTTNKRFYSVYLHVELSTNITRGMTVDREKLIGKIANTSPMPPHLHFEIRIPTETNENTILKVVNLEKAYTINGYCNPIYAQKMIDAGNVEPSEFIRFNNSLVLAKPGQPTVQIDGKICPIEGYEIQGSNYFKLRDLATLLNNTSKKFDLYWNKIKNAVEVLQNQEYKKVGGELAPLTNKGVLLAKESNAKVIVEGQVLGATTYNIENNNYLKLRDVGTGLDFAVDWDPLSQTIKIDTTKGYNNSGTAIPQLISPESNTSLMVGDSVALSWSNTGAAKYKVEMINDTGAGTFSIDTTQTNYPFKPIAEGYWRWQVRAYSADGKVGDASVANGILVMPKVILPPTVPVLLKPDSGSVHNKLAPTLYWNSIINQSGGEVKYLVETFDSPRPQSSGWITVTNWRPNLADNTTGLYNWRVKSRDTLSGKESGWSNPWQFTIQAEYAPPTVPSLSSPSSGSSYSKQAPTLYWNSVASQTGGQVKYYAETYDCPSSQSSGWTYSTGWRPNYADNTSGTYNWRVKSMDTISGKESGWSNPWQFTMQAEYAPPTVPILSSPNSGTFYSKQAPTLYWSSVVSQSGGGINYFAETFDSPIQQSSGWINATSWRANLADNTPGLYNWRVKSRDSVTGKESGWSNPWQFTIQAEYLPPSVPVLTSPTNGVKFSKIAPTLIWNPIKSPSGFFTQYLVQTFDCPNPQSSDWILETSWRPDKADSSTGLYNWRVKSKDTLTGKESGWSNPLQFNMQAEYAPPNTPIPSSPAYGSTSPSSAPTLAWTAVSSQSNGLVQYRVEIFDSPVNYTSEWTNFTSWKPSQADGKPGTYNWRVKSIDINSGKESGWSNPSRFIINAADSTDLWLDIRRAMYGANGTEADVTPYIRPFIQNGKSISLRVDNSINNGNDPVFGVKKQLVVTYRNRWNEEWIIIVTEGDSLNLTDDSQIGQRIKDCDFE